IAEGSFVALGGITYNVTYSGGDGNDVALTRVARFDFNAPGSPNDTANGYQSVLPSNIYPGCGGFGWTVAALAVDRGTPADPLLRDLNYGTDRTFRITVMPGLQYQVTLITGDGTTAHDNFQVTLEGAVQPGLITSPAGQFVASRY